MAEDPRCCGSGTCIIDPDGRCWCGQQWDGVKMSAPAPSAPPTGASGTAVVVDPDREAHP
jgi:hypothetical protein